MGAWGIGISSNDTFADVYGDFFDLYNEGMDVPEITAQLKHRYASIITDSDENHDFWFALAKAQWECKQLEPSVMERVAAIIEGGDNIRIWKELGSSAADLRKRTAALVTFLSKLRIEKERARKRKKKVIRDPIFEKGACLTFRLADGNYGGAVVLEAVKGTEYNYNLIATTRLSNELKPTVADFEKAELLVLNHSSFKDKPELIWRMPVRHKTVPDFIEVVGQIEVEIVYSVVGSSLPFEADFDLADQVNRQLEFELSNPRSRTRLTIKEVTKRSRWRLGR